MKARSASRLRTAEAILGLCLARLLVAAVPLRWWLRLLGRPMPDREGIAPRPPSPDPLAGNIARAAQLIPLRLRCLPQAIALAWMLRRRKRSYVLKLAVRPRGARAGEDALHAWIESGGRTVNGYLPGPWLVVFAVGRDKR